MRLVPSIASTCGKWLNKYVKNIVPRVRRSVGVRTFVCPIDRSYTEMLSYEFYYVITIKFYGILHQLENYLYEDLACVGMVVKNKFIRFVQEQRLLTSPHPRQIYKKKLKKLFRVFNKFHEIKQF